MDLKRVRMNGKSFPHPTPSGFTIPRYLEIRIRIWGSNFQCDAQVCHQQCILRYQYRIGNCYEHFKTYFEETQSSYRFVLNAVHHRPDKHITIVSGRSLFYLISRSNIHFLVDALICKSKQCIHRLHLRLEIHLVSILVSTRVLPIFCFSC